jgi:hypothetical protein
VGLSFNWIVVIVEHFNVLLCLGAAGLFGRIDVAFDSIAVDVGAMIALTLIGAVLLCWRDTGRR